MGEWLLGAAFLTLLAAGFYVAFVLPLRAGLSYLAHLRHLAAHQPKTTFPPRRRVEERRCPYCHDGLSEPGAVCSDCLAHHHPECREEHGACAACGGQALLGLEGRRRTHPLRRGA